MAHFLNMDPYVSEREGAGHVRHKLTEQEQDLEMLFQALKAELLERWGNNHSRAFLALDTNRDGLVDAQEVQKQLHLWNIFPTLPEVSSLLFLFSDRRQSQEEAAGTGLTLSQFSDFMRASHAVRAFDDGYDDREDQIALPSFRKQRPAASSSLTPRARTTVGTSQLHAKKQVSDVATFDSPAGVTDLALGHGQQVIRPRHIPQAMQQWQQQQQQQQQYDQQQQQQQHNQRMPQGASQLSRRAVHFDSASPGDMGPAPSYDRSPYRHSNADLGSGSPARPPPAGAAEAVRKQQQLAKQSTLDDFKEAFLSCTGIDRDGFVALGELQVALASSPGIAASTTALIFRALGGTATRAGRVQYREYLQAATSVLQEQEHDVPSEVGPSRARSGRMIVEEVDELGEKPVGYGVHNARPTTPADPPAPQWKAPWSSDRLATPPQAQGQDLKHTGANTEGEESAHARAEQLSRAVEDLRDQLAERWGEENFRKAFLACDLDRSGAVGANELRALLKRVNLLTPDSDRAVEALIAECGQVARVQDGRIPYAAFVRVLSRQPNTSTSARGVGGAPRAASETAAQFQDRGRNNRFGVNDADLARMVRDNAKRQLGQRHDDAVSAARRRQQQMEHQATREAQRNTREQQQHAEAAARQRRFEVEAEQQELMANRGNPLLASAWAGESHAGAASRLLVELSAAIHTRFGSRQFQRAFLEYDRDRSGFISGRNILEMLHDRGIHPSEPELQALIAAFNPSSGRISFNDFVRTLSFVAIQPGSGNHVPNFINGGRLSEYDGEFQDYSSVRPHPHPGMLPTPTQSLQGKALPSTARTQAGGQPLDYPEWSAVLSEVFDSCSGRLMSSLHLGPDTADAGILLQQLMAHPRLCGENGTPTSRSEILELMDVLTEGWLRAGGRVGTTGCCFVQRASFQSAIAVPPPSVQGPIAQAMRDNQKRAQNQQQALEEQRRQQEIADEESRRRNQEPHSLRERGIAHLALRVPAGAQTQGLDEAAVVAAPGGFGTTGAGELASDRLFVAGPSSTFRAVERVTSQFPTAGKRRALHAGLQQAFAEEAAQRAELEARGGGGSRVAWGASTGSFRTAASNAGSTSNNIITNDPKNFDVSGGLSSGVPSTMPHGQWRTGMLAAYDWAVGEWRRIHGGSGEDMDPDDLRRELLARVPTLCKSKREVDAIVKRSLFAGRLDRAAYERILDCGEFPWKRRSEADELSLKMQSAVVDAWGESMRSAFLHVDSDRTGFVDRSELEALLERQNLNRDPAATSALLDAADSNHDGRLSFQEFSNALRTATYRQARISEAQDGFREPPTNFYERSRADMPQASTYNPLYSSVYNLAQQHRKNQLDSKPQQSLLGETQVTSSLMAAPPPPPHELSGIARDRIRAKVLGSKAGLFGGFLNHAGPSPEDVAAYQRRMAHEVPGYERRPVGRAALNVQSQRGPTDPAKLPAAGVQTTNTKAHGENGGGSRWQSESKRQFVPPPSTFLH